MKYLIPVLCSLLLLGCSDTPSNDAPAEVQNIAATEAATPEMNVSDSAANETAAAVPPAEEVIVPAAPVVTSDAKPAEESKKSVPAPKVEKPVAEAPTAAVASTVDGAATFAQKCASCHGQKAEKSALGKSQVIAGWNAQQVKDALHGYQSGTYGKEMKALMSAQAKGLSDAQIEALAKHISAL